LEVDLGKFKDNLPLFTSQPERFTIIPKCVGLVFCNERTRVEI